MVAEKKRLSLRAMPVRRVRARFDSAQTTEDNRRHWANADGLSADAAANAGVRRTFRNRARYEVANRVLFLAVIRRTGSWRSI